MTLQAMVGEHIASPHGGKFPHPRLQSLLMGQRWAHGLITSNAEGTAAQTGSDNPRLSSALAGHYGHVHSDEQSSAREWEIVSTALLT